MIKFRNELIENLEKTNSEKANKKKEYENLIKQLKNKYNEWLENRISIFSDELVRKFIKNISKGIEKNINLFDFFKEVFNKIPIFNSDKEGPISNKMNKLIDEKLSELINNETKGMLEQCINEIDNLLEEFSLNYSKKSSFEIKINEQLNNQDFSPDVDFKLLINKVVKTIKNKGPKKLIKELVKKIAKKDLRRRGSTQLKKFIVRACREILKKSGKKIVVKTIKKAPTKGIPVIGWLIFAYDIIDVGFEMANLNKEIQYSLKDQIYENQSEFKMTFENITKEIALTPFEEVISEIEKEFYFNEDKGIIEINNKIDFCSTIIEKLEKGNVIINKISKKL